MNRNEAAAKYRELRSKSVMNRKDPAKFDERCAARVADAKDPASWVEAAEAVIKSDNDYIADMSRGTRGRG